MAGIGSWTYRERRREAELSGGPKPNLVRVGSLGDARPRLQLWRFGQLAAQRGLGR